MPTFDWAESAGSGVSQKPRVLETKFGDGYSQTSPDGLNHNPGTWSLRFVGVDDPSGNEIMAFLSERGGWQSFDWAPPWGTAPIKVKCMDWGRTQPDAIGRSDISATFNQVYEP